MTTTPASAIVIQLLTRNTELSLVVQRKTDAQLSLKTKAHCSSRNCKVNRTICAVRSVTSSILVEIAAGKMETMLIAAIPATSAATDLATQENVVCLENNND